MGTRLKLLRQYFGLTQKEFAEKIGVSLPTVKRWESSNQKLDDRTIKLISELFNISENWLKTGEGEMIVKNDSDKVSRIYKAIERIRKNKVQKYLQRVIENSIKEKNIDELLEIFADILEEIAEEIEDNKTSKTNLDINGNINIGGKVGKQEYK